MSSKIGNKNILPTLNISRSTRSTIDTYLNNNNEIGNIYYDIGDKKLYFYNDIDISNYRNIIINDISNIDLSDNVTIHGKLISIGDSSFNGNINVNDICLANINSLIPGGTITFNDGVTFAQSVTYDAIATFGNSVHNSVNIENELDISQNGAILYANDISLRNLGGLENDHFDIISDVSFQKNVEISNNLIVTYGEASFNKLLKVPDASFDNIGSLDNKALQIVTDTSFQRNVEISDNLIVTYGEVSFNKLLKVPDASFENIGSLDDNAMQIVSDASFQSNVEISNNLNVTYGEVSFNKLLRVPDASFNKIGSLNVDQALQIVTDASFQSKVEISDNLIVTYGEVSFNKLLRVPDASFNNIGSLNDDQGLQIVTDASFQSNVEISNNLNVTHGEVSFNKLLRVPDASFNNIGSLNDNKALQIVTDGSFQSNVEISNNLIVTNGKLIISSGDSSFNGNINVNDICLVNINSLIPGGTITFNDGVTFAQSVSYDAIATFGNSVHNLVNIETELDISRSDAVIYANDISLRNLGGLENDHFDIISDVSFQSNVEISNNLIVTYGEVSFNKLLRVPDASFENIGSLDDNAMQIVTDASFQSKVEISNNLIVTHGEVSFNKLLRVPDASFNKIGNLNGSSLQINTDVSFNNSVNITGNLTIDGSFSFSEVIQNITTISNEILISTQLDICNQGTGPALEVTQIGTGVNNDVALFNSDVDVKAFEIKDDGKSIFYKDVSFNTKLIVPDASFNNIGSLDGKELQIVSDASFQKSVDISGKLVVKDDVSFNAHLSAVDASFQNDVDIGGKLVVNHDVSFNGVLNTGFVRKEVLLAGAGGLNGTGGLQGDASSSTFHNNIAIYGPLSAFNGRLTNGNDIWLSDQTSPKYIQFKFPYDVIVTKYKIWRKARAFYGYDSYPTAWKLKGSNDGVTFVEIDVKTAIADDWTATPVSNSIINDSERNEYDVDDTTTAYRTIRMEITDHQSAQVAIGELAFYGYYRKGAINTRDLVVNGDAYFENNVDITGKLVVDGDVSFNAHLSVIDASFQNNVDISGKLVVDGDVSFNAHLSAVDASFQKSVDISGKLVVKDDVSFNAHLSAVDASFQNDVDITGKLVVKDDVSFNAHLSVLDASFQNDVDITGKLVVNGAGVSSTNVDIGGTTITNSGSAILLLQSPNNSNCSIKSCAGPNLTAGQHEIEFHHYVAGRGYENTIKFKLHNGTSTATPQDVLTLVGNGKVGIGTTTPIEQLELKKQFTTAGLHPTSNLLFSTTNGTDNWNVGSIGGYINAGPGNSNASYPGGLLFKTKDDDNTTPGNLTTRMVINADGNVGIGTTTPTQKLHVIGNINCTGTISVAGVSVAGGALATTNTTQTFIANTTSSNGTPIVKRFGSQYRESSQTSPFTIFHDSIQVGGSKKNNSVYNGGTLELVGFNSLIAMNYSSSKLILGNDYDGSGKISIGNTNPDVPFTINSNMQTKNINGTTYTMYCRWYRGSGNWYIGSDNTTSWNHNLYWFANTSSTGHPLKRVVGFENDTARNGMVSSFTGQHRNIVKNVNPVNIESYIGLIVTADNNENIKVNGGVERGLHAITINETIPYVSVTNKSYDKKVFGVISASEDPENRSDLYGRVRSMFTKEDGDDRIFINSIGEGAMWISNQNGSLESGDYVTSSNIPGYGMIQSSEFLANYTVAKMTMDCDFQQTPRIKYKIKSEFKTVNYFRLTKDISANTRDISENTRDISENTRDISDISANTSEQDFLTENKYNLLDDETKEKYTLEKYDEDVNILDENGQIQWEDSGETEAPYKVRYLLPDSTQISKEEYNTRLLANEEVYVSAFVGCTYHCG